MFHVPSVWVLTQVNSQYGGKSTTAWAMISTSSATTTVWLLTLCCHNKFLHYLCLNWIIKFTEMFKIFFTWDHSLFANSNKPSNQISIIKRSKSIARWPRVAKKKKRRGQKLMWLPYSNTFIVNNRLGFKVSAGIKCHVKLHHTAISVISTRKQ